MGIYFIPLQISCIERFVFGLGRTQFSDTLYLGVAWYSALDKTGRTYYYEENGNQSCWNLPNVSQTFQVGICTALYVLYFCTIQYKKQVTNQTYRTFQVWNCTVLICLTNPGRNLLHCTVTPYCSTELLLQCSILCCNLSKSYKPSR